MSALALFSGHPSGDVKTVMPALPFWLRKPLICTMSFAGLSRGRLAVGAGRETAEERQQECGEFHPHFDTCSESGVTVPRS